MVPCRAPKGFLFLTTVFLSACSGIVEVRFAPTLDLDPIYTAAAKTHSAELTASATESTSTPNNQSATNSPQASATRIYTATFIPESFASSPTASALPLTPTQFLQTVTPLGMASEVVCDAAITLRHLTFASGSLVRLRQHFYKEWLVQNTGSCPWYESYWVVHVEGSEFRYKPHKLRKVSEPTIVWPGEVAEIGIDLWAPNKLGRYTSTFQLMNDWGGYPFGRLRVNVLVVKKK